MAKLKLAKWKAFPGSKATDAVADNFNPKFLTNFSAKADPKEETNMNFTDEEIKGLTIEDVQQEYSNKSKKANEVGNQVAWMLMVVLSAMLVSGKVYTEILISGGFAVLAMWLGVMQRLWQVWTIWLFKLKMERLKVYNSHGYPCYIRNGAWIIYWLKMVSLTVAVGWFVYGTIC